MKAKEVKPGDVITIDINSYQKITIKAIKQPMNVIAKCGQCAIFHAFKGGNKAPCLAEHDPLKCSSPTCNIVWKKI